MQFHNLKSLPTALSEQLDKHVEANRKQYLTRHLPVSTALALISVPVHLQAKSFNSAHLTVESGVFLLASALVMLVFIGNTGVIALSLWVTRPRDN